MREESGELDKIDGRMIDALALDGRITITDLAKQVGISKTPCQIRMQRLIEKGYIKGFRAHLDHQKLGLAHLAYAEVKLRETNKAALDAFNTAVLLIPEIEQCDMIAGPFDYLLKVRTSDINAYREVLGERISELPFVASSSTYVVMQSVKDSGE